MRTALLMFGMLTGAFLSATAARLFSPREETANVEGSGGQA